MVPFPALSRVAIAGIFLVGAVACAIDVGAVSRGSDWKPPSDERIAELKQFLLERTNEERAKHGAPPVSLGANFSPQAHAEDQVRHCYASHWDTAGMKPLYRYHLAGGDQYAAENVSGSSFCPEPGDNSYESHDSGLMGLRVRRAVDGWLASPGHRRTMLDPRHKVMHAGIAFSEHNHAVVQVFSGEYVRWSRPPAISESGLLTAEGILVDAFWAPLGLGHVPVSIEYHPLVEPLDVGQLNATYCLENDVRVGSVLPPLEPGNYYVNDETGERYVRFTRVVRQNEQCVNPYELPAGNPGPASVEDSLSWHRQAVRRSRDAGTQSSVAYEIVARRLDYDRDSHAFAIMADVRPVLDLYGAGIYTITIWGTTGHGINQVVAQYPVVVLR